VKNREKSWRPIREDAEDMEELSSQVAESAELVIVLDRGEAEPDNYVIKKYSAYNC
jgi:hypothetical protein